MTDDISVSTLRRLPFYYHYLLSVRSEKDKISASQIASHFGLNDVQVRKDLGVVSGTGRPKTGYDTDELIGQIERCLGCKTNTSAVIVGPGNLGRALLSYSGFADYGLSILAAFDDKNVSEGRKINGKPLLSIDSFEEYCSQNDVRLGIITTPADAAQSICDRMISCGIKAVWNFAPTILRAPSDVLVENENLASSLAILSKHLKNDTSDN